MVESLRRDGWESRFAAEHDLQFVAVGRQQVVFTRYIGARIACIKGAQAAKAVPQVGADDGGAHGALVAAVGQGIDHGRAERRHVLAADAGVPVEVKPVTHQFGIGAGLQLHRVGIGALARKKLAPAGVKVHLQARTGGDHGDGGCDFGDEVGFFLARRRQQRVVGIAFTQAQRGRHQPVQGRRRWCHQQQQPRRQHAGRASRNSHNRSIRYRENPWSCYRSG